MMSLIVIGGLLVAACRPAATPTPAPTPAPGAAATPAPTPVKPSGELRIALTTLFFEMLDPHRTPNDSKISMTDIFDYLIDADDEGKPLPEKSLAEKWEASPDNKVWTFYIRDGVKFHNGDALTPEDVKFSLERAMGAKISTATYRTALQGRIDTITVEPPNKLVFKLKASAPLFLFDLGPYMGLEGMVLPKQYLEAKGDDYFAENPIGSGPYRLKDRVFGSYMRFEAQDSHWRVGVPKYKYIVFLKVPEEGTRLAMLKRGEADIIDISLKNIPDIEKAGLGIRTQQGARVVGFYWQRAYEADNPLRDVRVRQAISYAINREEMMKFIFMGKGKAHGNFQVGSWALGFKEIPEPYDVAKAKALLTEAGYPGGKGVNLTIYAYPGLFLPEFKETAEAVAGYLNEVGIKTSIITMDYPAFRSAWMAHTTLYPSINVFGIANRAVVASLLYGDNHSSSLFYQFNDPKWDAQLDRLLITKSLDEFKQVVTEVNRFEHDNYMHLSIGEADMAYGVNPKKVGEWNLGRAIYDFSLHNVFKQK